MDLDIGNSVASFLSYRRLYILCWNGVWCLMVIVCFVGCGYLLRIIVLVRLLFRLWISAWLLECCVCYVVCLIVCLFDLFVWFICLTTCNLIV